MGENVKIGVVASAEVQSYFKDLVENMIKIKRIAEAARSKGMDPLEEVEMKIAPDMPSRVEELVGPEGIAEDIRKIMNKGFGREEIAAQITKKIVKDMLPGNMRSATLSSEELGKVIEQAMRTGVAIITDGVLVAPTEGIPKLKVLNNPDNTRYVAIYYAGPIRSSGGTSAAVSALLVDIIRKEVGLQEFRPTEKLISRYVEEINLYDARCARLQYLPSEREIKHIVSNCPVCITGEPTSKVEVSINRDIESIETNFVRGGMALVIGEGIAQKASKILKISKRLGNPWSWLEGIVKVKTDEAKRFELKPLNTFMTDVVAGRPVFSYAMSKGGFRLRYGRTRATGIMAKALHPVAFYLLDEFPAIGTQLKIERPGKACIVTPCETIEPPVVRLKNGDVLRVDTVEFAKQIKGEISEILFLGDILSPIGDFIKTAHPIFPSGYVEEWWVQDCEKAGAGSEDVIKKCLKDPFKHIPRAEESIIVSYKYSVPLHPRYTYPWNDITREEYNILKEWLIKGSIDEQGRIVVFLENDEDLEAKRVLEILYIPHRVIPATAGEKVGRKVVINTDDSLVLSVCLGLGNKLVSELCSVLEKCKSISGKSEGSEKENNEDLGMDHSEAVLEIVNRNANRLGVKVKNKISAYIGTRMGRPEKARQRTMKTVNVLFPIGMSQRNRNMTNIYRIAQKDRDNRFVDVQIVRMVCRNCNNVTVYPVCEVCGSKTAVERTCLKGHKTTTEKCHVCGSPTRAYDSRKIDLLHYLDIAKKNVDCEPLNIKAPKGLASRDKNPELLEKGILRAKYGLNVFKDGTCRFDFINATLTHFKPKEIGTTVEKLKEFGYTHDYKGRPLTDEDQVIEMFPQDTIVSDSGLDFMYRVAQFIDDLLVYVYKLPPFYKAKDKKDMIGHLIVTQSPHTAAGILSRVIGVSKTRVGWYHPYLICATRRNCDGDENSFYLLLDAFINFSKKYLPSSRGSTQDTPLVLTTTVNPLEIDDEVYVMEIGDKVPLEFFEGAERYCEPIQYVKLVKDILGKEGQYRGMEFSHKVDSINNAPAVTTYVRVDNMIEKMYRQFELNRKIRAVDVRDSVRRMIVGHFLPDMYGNLRTFSRQTFRCISCNTKYRRVPLKGVCTKCGGKLVLTVSKGNIEKYLNISLKLVEEYDLPNYLKQRLQFIKKDLESIFVDEKKKQVSLMDFM